MFRGGRFSPRIDAVRWSVVFVFALVSILAGAPSQAGVQLASYSVANGPPPPPETTQGPTSHSGGISPAGTGTGALATSDLPTNDLTVGTTTGHADTVGGAATYTIPISVPPGRAGMQPSIALTYNSRGGNGAMGVGWSISGPSSIHRCPRTPDQDGQTLGVNYGATDRLCLDGQRLVATSGTYGTIGTVYHTEIDSYARVTQYGGDIGTSDATCFVIEHRDGQVSYYGGTPTKTGCAAASSSHVIPGGAPRTLSWLIASTQDRVGNNEVYSYYAPPGSSGEVLISSIAYTGFTDSNYIVTPGNRLVTFNYAARTSTPGVSDFASSYLAGGLSMQTQELTSIVTSVAGTTLRVYKPGYTAATYSSRLLMNNVQECAGSACDPMSSTWCSTATATAACHRPTAFSYNDSALQFSLKPLNSNIGIQVSSVSTENNIPFNPYTFTIISDLDGDGTREAFASVPQNDGNTHKYLVQLTGDRVAHTVIELTGTNFERSATFDFDVDGSGRSATIQVPVTSTEDQHLSLNIWKLGRGTAYVPQQGATPAQNFAALFNNYPTNIPYPYPPTAQNQNSILTVSDIEASGYPDVLVTKQASGCGADSKGVTLDGLYAYRYTGGKAVDQVTTPLPFSEALIYCFNRGYNNGFVWEEAIDHVGDFNGDGLPDLYLTYAGTDLFDSSTNPNGRVGNIAGVVLTKKDSNGNLVKQTSATSCTAMGLVSDPGLLDDDCSLGLNHDLVHWMDVNGDGLEDFVIARPNQGTWRIRLNTGGSLAGTEIDTGSSDGLTVDDGGGGKAFRYATRFPVMDVDGDGRPDLLIPSLTQGSSTKGLSGFAVKMCTMLTVQAVANICPGEDAGHSGSVINASPSSSGLPISQCAVYSCPEDVGSMNVTMPANDLGASGAELKAYPYKWRGTSGEHPAFASHSQDTQSLHPSGGYGIDNSTYHLAALKFVQTGAGSFTTQVVETPMVASGGTPQDLFGDGLPDLTASIGCNGKQAIVAGKNTYYCAVVADGVNGPNDALPDGAHPCDQQSDGSCYFEGHPVLYANINQGVAALGGSNSSIARPASPMSYVGGCPEPSSNGQLLPTPYLPGVMDGVVNGIGDVASWGYCTLSMPEKAFGFPLYSVPSSVGYVDSKHYYVQSSMPIVYGMQQSAGTGDSGGFRSATYGYSQGIYNHVGRGFEGFYQIRTRVDTQDASTAVQSRDTETITTFNQKFPLVGRVAKVQHFAVTSTGTQGTKIEEEADSYICTLSNRTACDNDAAISPNATSGGTIYAPVLDKKSVYRYDLATGTEYAETDTDFGSTTTTGASGWDAYGNLLGETVTTYEVGSPTFWATIGTNSSGSRSVITTNQYDTSSAATSWWVNKLTGSSTTASVAYDATNHNFVGDTTTLTQTVSTAYTWNSDRTVQTKTIQPNIANQESTTVYCYPLATATTSPPCPKTTGSVGTTSYGLPTTVKLCLGYYDSSGVCQGDVTSGLSPERTASYQYTKGGSAIEADGYFVLNRTNGLGQTTQTTHQPSDGQTLTTTDPNNVKVTTTYDPFGRPLTIDHVGNTGTNIEPTIQLAYNSCLKWNTASPPTASAGNCDAAEVGEEITTNASFEGSAAYRVTTVQSGYSTKVSWSDVLGRSVKEAHRGFDGRFIASLVGYDDLGTVANSTSPYFVATATTAGTNPFLTKWTYDALDRPTKKIVDDSDLTTGRTTRNTLTSYSGRITTETVADSAISLAAQNACPTSAGNLCLQTVRSVNGAGDLMQVTEKPILGGSAVTITTNYWTDPLGHVVGIADPDGNNTTASYNALGQRTKSTDPDQGTWKFEYDALGEQTKQTDARGVVTMTNAIDVLGRVKEREELPPTGTRAGLDSNVILDDWTYDPANGVGEINSATRTRGTNRTTPSLNPTVWTESYTYEAATARPKSISTSTTESSTVALSTSLAYDSTTGHLLSRTYPSNLTVTYGYTSFGQLSSLSNGSTAYWTATNENEWGHVTGETFSGGSTTVTGSHSDYDSTGQAATLSWPNQDNISYKYDSFGNLVKQIRTVGSGTSATNTEVYVYDPLQRLASATRTLGGVVNYTYTNSGNITSKSDFSTTTGTPYSYAGANATVNNCGPHAVNAVSLPGSLSAIYNCDVNGNVISGNTITAAAYDAANRPTSITRRYLEPNTSGDKIFCNGFQTGNSTCPNGVPAGGSNTWAYDSNGMRSYEHSSGVDRYYGPGGYERTIGASTAHVHELGPVIVTRVGGVDSVTYVLHDRLGSTLDTVDGSKTTGRAYDAFGKARNADMSDRLNGTLNLSDTIHGFTSHTHEDETALVHMNGRVFDPNLGRFLSVDPVGGIGSQRLNPYSYLMNGPFAGTDPTGFDTDSEATQGIAYDSNSICAKSFGSCSNGTVTSFGSNASFFAGRSSGGTNAGGASGASAGEGPQTTTGSQQSSTDIGNPTAQNPQVAGQGSQQTTTLETVTVWGAFKQELSDRVEEAQARWRAFDNLSYETADDLEKVQQRHAQRRAIREHTDFYKTEAGSAAAEFLVMAAGALVAPEAGGEEAIEARVAEGSSVAGDSVSAMRRMEFEPADYHGTTDRGRKSRGPVNGQDALDLSVRVKSTSPRRVGIDYKTGDFVVFDRTREGIYHGHVRGWSDLHQDQQRALIDSGMVDQRGNIWRGD